MKIYLRQSYSFILQGKRSNQEDCRYPDSDLCKPDQHFFIVCDGVGGQDRGEVASHLVCQSIASQLSHYNWNDNFSNADFARLLDTAYDELDAHAHDYNREMATTLVFASFHGGGMTLAHIGDSRIYHVRPEEGIIYRSDDHSMVNSMVHSGIITPEEASSDSRRHIITRYMSPTDSDQTRCMATVLRTADVQGGDYVFLCSDGVLQSVDDDALVEIISSYGSDENIMNEIKTRCGASSDNSTAILIHVDKVEQTTKIYTENNPHYDSNASTISYNHNETGTVNIASTMRTQKYKESGLSRFLKRIFG